MQFTKRTGYHDDLRLFPDRQTLWQYLVLFAVLPDVLVCYRCRARHRTAGGDDRTTFDLETAERYRQERIRAAGQ